jgi:hypothetical protein
MAQTSNLELLCRLRDAVSRAHELERADLDRQIKALERSRPITHATRICSLARMRRGLSTMSYCARVTSNRGGFSVEDR